MEVNTHYLARDIPMTGELLNDELELVRMNGRQFDPHKVYRVRISFRGRELLGEWDAEETS